MDSPEQSDLLQPRPTSIPSVSLQELELQCQDLKTLLHASLVALFVLGSALGLFLAKQMRMVRAELAELRPVVQRIGREFKQKEPKMKGFISALQAYALSNRDFQPVLDRYRAAVPEYFVSALPLTTAPILSPAPTNAPGRVAPK